MIVVVDASVVVAALVDGGLDGQWAEGVLLSGDLAAPHLVLVEAANILRRSALRGQITDETAAAAYQDLLDLRLDLYDYEPFAQRIWQLRANVTSYDGWYVALAEHLKAPLGTLDRRLIRATGPECTFLDPIGTP